MKIVSIDIETTGIDPMVCQVVQLGAVLFDTNGIFAPKIYDKIIIQNEYHGEEFALNMNKRIIEMGTVVQSMGVPDEYKNMFVHVNDLANDFRKWLNKHKAFNGEKSINVAGKNVAGFDMQFLAQVPDFTKRVPWKRRTLDPAILCFNKDDKFLPDLHECVKRTFKDFATKNTAHLGASDALDVAAMLYVHLNGNRANHMIYCGRMIDKISEKIQENFDKMYNNLCLNE